MDRRLLLGGFAAALVAVPALAQTGASPTTRQQGAAGAGASRAGAMGQDEMQHMEQTMQLGMATLETSRIAQNKLQNDDLKQFAGFEIQEQTTLAEVMRSMMEPAATAATGNRAGASGQAAGQMGNQSGMMGQGSMAMDANAREMMQRLQNQQAGAEFDRMYLDQQLQGHRNLLQAQERFLQSNPRNREHMNVAKLARGQIMEHIALLEDIQQKM